MKKIKTLALLGITFMSLMVCGCHKEVGLDFEKIYKEDITNATNTYKNENVSLYAVYGCLNKTFEEIIAENIDINDVYFTDVYTVFQVGDNVVQYSHNGTDKSVSVYEYSFWDDSYKLEIPDQIIPVEDALSKYIVQTDTVVPGNIIAIRNPFEMNDSLGCYYLFGYDSIYTIMDVKGLIVK